MMTDCTDTVETPAPWHGKKKKNRACFKSGLFPWVSQMHQLCFTEAEISCE